MTTKLTKDVRRELQLTDRKGRPLMVTLSPAGFMTFRPKGSKRSVSVYFGHVFNLAQLVTVDQEYSAAIKQYNADKSIGKRRRRPVRPVLPFGKALFDSLK